MNDEMRPGMERRKWVCAAVLCTTMFAGAQTATQQYPIGQGPAQPEPAPPKPAPAAPAAPNTGWKVYHYTDDGFSAEFPAQPTMQKQNVPTTAGTFELHSYVAEEGAAALYVGVCDYGDAAKSADPQAILEGAQNGAINNVSAHVLSSGKITLGVYPGLTFEAENTTLHFSAHIYIVGTTLYQILIASPLGQPYTDTAKFLSSFQLVGHTAP